MASSGTWNIEWASGTWQGQPKSYHWSGNFARSGNTITLSNMKLWFTVTGNTAYANNIKDTVTITGGSAQTATWNFSNSTTSNVVSLSNTSFSVATSATSATIQCAIAGENTGSKTISFDAGGSAPTGLSVSVAEVYSNGAKFNVSVSSYGSPASADGRRIEAGIAGQNAWQSPSLRSQIATNTASTQITVTNASTQTTTLDIQPNTQYYYGGYANNTVLNVKQMFGQLVTLAAEPVVSLVSTTGTSATFSYTIPADGGHYDKTIKYSLDGGSTWTTLTIVTGGAAKTGTFTVQLTSTTKKVIVTSTTTAGTSRTEYYINGTNALYGSVSGKTKTINKVYGSVNGQTKTITKIYGSVNGKTKLIYQQL